MKLKRTLLFLGILLLIAVILISCLPRDSFIKLPLLNIYIVKLVDLPYDTKTTRAVLGYGSQSWNLYLDYHSKRGYTYLGIGDAGVYEFEKDGVISRLDMPDILQFSWFI